MLGHRHLNVACPILGHGPCRGRLLPQPWRRWSLRCSWGQLTAGPNRRGGRSRPLRAFADLGTKHLGGVRHGASARAKMGRLPSIPVEAGLAARRSLRRSRLRPAVFLGENQLIRQIEYFVGGNLAERARGRISSSRAAQRAGLPWKGAALFVCVGNDKPDRREELLDGWLGSLICAVHSISPRSPARLFRPHARAAKNLPIHSHATHFALFGCA